MSKWLKSAIVFVLCNWTILFLADWKFMLLSVLFGLWSYNEGIEDGFAINAGAAHEP